MAGMFYSLEEVAEKLGISVEEIKEIVKQGNLREFRDGPNQLFKVDEVEALMSDTSILGPKDAETPPEKAAKEEDIDLELEKSVTEEDIDLEPEKLVTEEETDFEPEKAVTEEEIEVESKKEPIEEDIALTAEPEKQSEDESSITGADTIISEKETIPFEETGDDFQLADELLDETDASSKEMFLADDSLGEAEAVADDTLLESDTTLDETTAESSEVSLEEIEEDVNLDTFGSGSGLLDLSLQADDTSLGGILDEIYTSEGEEGGESIGAASAMDVAAETLAETLPAELESPLPVRAYAEPEPDAISNAFGWMLFLPLLVIIYTAIITVAGFNDLIPSVLKNIQGLIWYILGGIFVVVLLIIGLPFMFSSETKSKPKKKKAKKKEKKPKVKKKKSKKVSSEVEADAE